MDRAIIFVGGIHGVGKTTKCQSIALKLGIQHFSSSDLIFGKRHDQSKTEKLVSNVESNQDLLVIAVNKHLKERQRYLLDGHFCLLDDDTQIVKIPLQTFKEIAPKAIVVVHDNTSKILTRLKTRDKKAYDLKVLQLLQDTEIEYAEQVSNLLGIPFLRCNLFEESECIEKFISRVFSKVVLK